MRRIGVCVALIALIAPAAARAAPDVTGGEVSKGVVQWAVTTRAGDLEDSKSMESGGQCSVTSTGPDTVEVYEVVNRSENTSGLTAETTIVGRTSTPYQFSPGQPYLRVKATGSPAGGTVVSILCSRTQIGAGGGGTRVDADGNGLYEIAMLYDADQDGSKIVICNGLQDPDPGCKAAGEPVYRDTVDDINTMLYGSDGLGVMEPGGTILLPAATLLGWPCWDASAPMDGLGPDNDPLATDDNLHDEVTDPSYQDCAVDETGRGLFTASTRWKQIKLIGQGMDLHPHDVGMMGPGTDRPTGRSVGTTLASDYGTDRGSAPNIGGSNVWYGYAATADNTKIKWISFGGQARPSTEQTQTGSGSLLGKTNLLGAGGVINAIDQTATFCFRDEPGGLPGTIEDKNGVPDQFVSALEAGDIIEIKNLYVSDQTYTVRQLFNVLEDGSNYTTVCETSGKEVTLGVYNRNYSDPALAADVNALGNGMAWFKSASGDSSTVSNIVGVLEEKWLNAAAFIGNVTLEPNDFPGEIGSPKCQSKVPWVNTARAPLWDEFQCDTGHMIGRYGHGVYQIGSQEYPVAVKHWANFAIDGDTNGHGSRMDNVTFAYGIGSPATDGHWDMSRIKVFSYMGGLEIFSGWSGIGRWDDIHVSRSLTKGLTTITPGNSAEIRNVVMEGNSQTYGINVQCDADAFTIDGLRISGWTDGPGTDYRICSADSSNAGNACTSNGECPGGVCGGVFFQGPGSYQNSGVIFSCIDPTKSNTGGWVNNVRIQNSGTDRANNGETPAAVGFSNPNGTSGAPIDDHPVKGNRFTNLYVEGQGGTEDCVVQVQDRGTANLDDVGESYVLSQNYFSGLYGTDGRVFGVSAASGGCDADILFNSGPVTPPAREPYGCGNWAGGEPSSTYATTCTGP